MGILNWETMSSPDNGHGLKSIRRRLNICIASKHIMWKQGDEFKQIFKGIAVNPHRNMVH